MMSFLIVLSLTLAISTDGAISPEQFARLVEAAHSEIHDLECTFEGDLRPTEEGLKKGAVSFQGIYAYRNDGALFLELYSRSPSNPSLFHHTVAGLIGSDLERFHETPDTGSVVTPHRETGSPAVLNEPYSPSRFMYYWYFRDLKNPRDNGFEFQGWEDVDGRRCLRVQFEAVPGAVIADAPVIRFWFDMERGCHPLRVEHLRGSSLEMCTLHVRLDRVSLPDGKQVWFPMYGETDYFLGRDGVSKIPLLHETNSVVKGSLRLNQGLTDKRFTVGWKGSKPSSAALERIRLDFKHAPIPPAPPEFSTDAASVRERLDKNLAAAEAQARQVEASSVMRETWSLTAILQIGFGLVGMGLIAGAGIFLWKRR